MRIRSLTIATVLLTAMLLVPVSSYAIIDGWVYGGYTFAGDFKYKTKELFTSVSKSKDLNGFEYGALAHVNFGMPMVFSLGLGGFFQQTPTKDVTKTDYGIDAMFMLKLPVIPFNPYVRGGVSINQNLKYDISGASDKSKYFNAYYAGGGIAVKVVAIVYVFGEYLYNWTIDGKGRSNSVHAGAGIYF